MFTMWVNSESQVTATTYTAKIFSKFKYNYPNSYSVWAETSDCEEAKDWSSGSKETKTILVYYPSQQMVAGARGAFSFSFSPNFNFIDFG